MTPEQQIAKLLEDVANMPAPTGKVELTSDDLHLIVTCLELAIDTARDMVVNPNISGKQRLVATQAAVQALAIRNKIIGALNADHTTH